MTTVHTSTSAGRAANSYMRNHYPTRYFHTTPDYPSVGRLTFEGSDSTVSRINAFVAGFEAGRDDSQSDAEAAVAERHAYGSS